MVPHPVFLISGLSLRFGDVDVYFLQSKVHDAVVPSSDHCRTDIVLPPPSDHYQRSIPFFVITALRVETVAPSGDHYCIDLVVPSSDHGCIETVTPSSDHY